ncbi:AAA family ATPase [Actinocatenispora sera]|uniref:LuxR family transcriptional regulator n=1 Tax=Actinocatenispora sera TaxID=390989 RepID=A0A810L8G9_9ACTN|nr:AAA family ATPase [Actinocatenispora sera]BCJ31593.1 LuxR family transcriptional regulator [Actinocatenispora sera]
MLEERVDELAAAQRALAAALSGRGQLVVVEGGIGAGKSALLAAVAGLGAAAGMWVSSAHATRLEREFGGAVVRQLLCPVLAVTPASGAAGWLAGPAAAAAPLFSDDPTVLAAVSRLQHDPDVGYGLRLVVRRICAQRPLLLVVDDLQRADALSLAFLADLVGCRDEVPLVLAVAVQHETTDAQTVPVDELVHAADVVLRPAPLSEPAVAGILRSVGRDPHDAAGIHRASRGNPLVVRSLVGTGGQPSGCPSPLRERLVQAFEVLTADVRAYARAMVLLPPGAGPATVSAVAGLDEAQSRFARRFLDRLGLLRPGLRGYAQAVVEDAMSPAELDEFHRRAAGALDSAGYPVDEVADECLAVSGTPPDCAARVLPAAARAALRAHDPHRAVRYLRRALIDCPVDGPERSRLLARLAEAELWTDPVAAMRHVGRAARLTDDVRSRAAMLSRLTPIALTGADDLSGLIDAAARALPGTPGSPPVDRELALRLEARRRFRDLDDGEALRDTLGRWAGYGSRPPIDTEAERELAAVLLYAATLTVRTSASQVGPLAARLLEHLPYRPLLAHTPAPLAVACALAAGELVDVADWLSTALLPDGRRTPDDLLLTLIGRATLHWLRGAVADCRRDLLEAARLARGAGATLDPTGAIGLVSTALKLADRKILDQVARVWPDPTAAPRPHLRLLAQTLRAALALDRGPTPAEWDDWEQCLAELERLGWRNPALLPVGSWSVRALVAAGRGRRARELMEREYDRATWWGSPIPVGRALRSLGRLTEGPAGVDLIARSADVLAESGNDAELGRTLIEYGVRLRAVGRPDAADQVVRGMRLARRAGADEVADRAAALLGEPGRGGAPLTPAELKVARLSAGGSSNRQIAELLGVTRRAVEKNLTSCYRKLGVPGRAMLAAKLAELFPAGEAVNGEPLR